MNVLVTGGSGFIGTRLVRRLLKKGNHVTIFDKRVSQVYPELVRVGDVRDADALVEAVKGKDSVYHLAAEHADDVRPRGLYHEVNVQGTANLARALDREDIRRVVFISTVALYGLRAHIPAEDAPLDSFNEYGASKQKAEAILHKWAVTTGTRSLIIVRPSVIFGEGNRGNVYNLIREIYSGRFIQVGNGKNRKSMGYVENIAAFLAEIVTFGPGIQVFNYADKPDLTMRELATIVRTELGLPTRVWRVPYLVGVAAARGLDALAFVTGRRFPVSAIRVRKFCAETVIDTTRLEGTGFKRPYSLEEGIRRMISAEFCA